MKNDVDLNKYLKQYEQSAQYDEEYYRALNEAAARCLAYTQKPDKSGDDIRVLIGMQESKPIFWNMSKQNVLASCDTGYGVYERGHNLPIMSIMEHYTREEVEYFAFVGTGTYWSEKYDEHCIGGEQLFRDANNADRKSNAQNRLRKILKARMRMSDEKLKKQKHIQLFFVNINVPGAYEFYKENKAIFDEIMKAVFENGKRLKMGIYLSGRPNMFDISPTKDMFLQYKYCFNAKLVGVCKTRKSSELLTGSDAMYYDKYRFVNPLMPKLPAIYICGDKSTDIKFPNTWQLNTEEDI